MRYKLLGRSGLRVSELCLGAMTFGDDWGWGADKQECARVFSAFVERGGNFIDTANHYTAGASERIVGELIAGERHRYVVATKYTLNQRPGDPNAGGNHRKCIVQSLEASLQRLGTDHIDLYWVHAWDQLTPVDEVMRALDDLVRAGKILYVGISDTPAWVVAKANTLADLRGWSRFVGLQIQYSLIERTPERELLPMAVAEDIAVTPWGILGMGALTGKYRAGEPRPADARFGIRQEWGDGFLTARNLEIAQVVASVAQAASITPSQVAIAWLRQRPFGTIVPILGARTLAQLEDNLGALDVMLDNQQLRRLDEASAVPLGFPHDFLADEGVRKLVHGGTWEQIDRPSAS